VKWSWIVSEVEPGLRTGSERVETPRSTLGSNRAFALVLVISLLALLVLLAYALSALSRVDSQLAGTAVHQVRARQNALLGLHLALGELQRHAGPDERITGMAGVTGASGTAPGANNPARHWCGVWNETGGHVAWLSSGATGSAIPPLNGADSLLIVTNGSLGADAADKEHVRVLKRPVTETQFGGGSLQGYYAYWVGDDGVKLSAFVPDAESPLPGLKHGIDELITALSPTAPNLGRVEAYGQLAFVPATALTPGLLQSNFHALGRTHYRQAPVAAGVVRQAGMLNINTTAARFWRGVAATYDRAAAPADRFSIARTTFANRMRDNFVAGTAPGKSPGGPFLHVDGFLSSTTLSVALVGSGVSLLEFRDTLVPWLTTRSDTFRIRAYGDAANPADPARVESTAYCEAIVQRTAEILPGFGRRFVITSFRWLGPDDI
jgi:hypothetical protein